jgi:hypothetical protein
MELAVADTGGKPFSFSKPPRPEPPAEVPRPPHIGEILGLLDNWAFAAIQREFPKAMKMPLAQLLRQAATGADQPPMRAVRTESALGFAVAERDCLTGPQWLVKVRFVVDRDNPGEAKLVRAALRDWAKNVLGAISFDDSAAPEPEAERLAAVVKAPARNRAKAGNTRARRRGSSARPSLKRERQALSSG